MALKNLSFRTAQNVSVNPSKINIKDDQYIEKFIDIVDSVRTKHIQTFIYQVFGNNDIAEAFVQVPASFDHHHDQIGGLLQHSVEVATFVSHQFYQTGHHRDLAIAAALVHDIGKTKTIKANRHMSTVGLQVNHDALTLEICASALSTLEKNWSTGASFLRHLLTFSNSKNYGYLPNSYICVILRAADQLSATLDLENRAFQQSNKRSGFAFTQNRRFFRPSNPNLLF